MKTFLAALSLTAATLAPGLAAAQDQITIAMIPKLVGIDYFAATEKGARQAVEELDNIRLIRRGPPEADVNAQIQLVENFITAGVDAIAVSANDPQAIAPVLQRAIDADIAVLTYDADAASREMFVNQVTFEGYGKALVDRTVKQVGEDANIAVVTSSLTAPNQSAWLDVMRSYIDESYPDLTIVDVRPAGEDQQRAFQVTQDLINVEDDLDAVIGLSSVAFPGAAEAVKQAGMAGDIAVIGSSTPKQMKPYMEAGVIEDVVLWNPVDLGYLTVYTADRMVREGLEVGDSFDAGRLGEREVREDERGKWVLLGDPFIFTEDNIDQFDF